MVETITKVFSLTILVILLSFLVLECTDFLSELTSTSAFAQTNQDTRLASKQDSLPSPPESVKGLMQKYPGGPMEVVEVAVHAVPVDVPSVDAEDAALNDNDLVLGVMIDGRAMAYPIRFLALYEIIDDQVGDTPLAPTW